MAETKKKRKKYHRYGPSPKNALKHGGHSAVMKYRERKFDLRRADDQAILGFQKAVIEDCGGATEMDGLQMSLLDRSVELLILLRCMSQHVEKNGIIEKNGELAPCLRSSFISYTNAFRRTMREIYAHRSVRAEEPSLEKIIKNCSFEIEEE